MSQLDFSYKRITAITANYTVTKEDHVILADATGGSLTVTLPAASTVKWKEYIIKKVAGSVFQIVTIDGNGAETIDASATMTVALNASAVLVCNGTAWFILSGNGLV